jgi:hypothetical protein
MDQFFLSEQDYVMQPATMFQDNQSTIHLLKNGQSNSKRTRHIEICYLFITDRIKRGDIQVIFKPTLEMMADIMTKPLPGNLFWKLTAQCHMSIPFLLQLLLPTLCRTSSFYTLHQHLSSKTRTLKTWTLKIISTCLQTSINFGLPGSIPG